MEDIINLIKTILPQILPVASLLLGILIKSSLDKNIDNKNYLRKYKENEISELKDYFKVFSKNYKNILDDWAQYNNVIDNPQLHYAFKNSLKNINDSDIEYILLMKNIYFEGNSLDDFLKSTFELTQLWIKNSQISDMGNYQNACTEMINKGRKC